MSANGASSWLPVSDATCGLIVLFAAASVVLAYGVRRLRSDFPPYPRVEADGGSALLGSGVMNLAYGALQPVASVCIALGVTANGVTASSLVLGAAAGVSLWQGHLGLGALLAMLSGVGDAVDGLVARRSGSASDAGEVLDATVDRYVEFFFLGGLALYYAGAPWAQGLALSALVGSFMMSYASAKAEALGVAAPRGTMRRPERAVYLTLAAALTPLTEGPGGVTPMIAALALVATVANASAIARLRAVARESGRRLVSVGGAPDNVSETTLSLREERS